MGGEVTQLNSPPILVEVIQREGDKIISLSNGQVFTWPDKESIIPPGQCYLIISSKSSLPSQENIVKAILKEILDIE